MNKIPKIHFIIYDQQYDTCFYSLDFFLITDLGEVGTVVSKNELKKPESLAGKDGESKVEEEFTVARLYVSKMKSEVKNLVHKASMLESSQSEGWYTFFLQYRLMILRKCLFL